MKLAWMMLALAACASVVYSDPLSTGTLLAPGDPQDDDSTQKVAPGRVKRDDNDDDKNDDDEEDDDDDDDDDDDKDDDKDDKKKEKKEDKKEEKTEEKKEKKKDDD
ncbi:uncharacterized protein [Procambarus clarkii]|uniref:uncharacterized protein isoform X1 n=2 Tax=Procambarus clarkii TaxID=6728 RepID=UPI001E675A71|nr:phosphopantothenoylcysteine decarboxylase subunit VHS3-like [Procambarus clarkii]